MTFSISSSTRRAVASLIAWFLSPSQVLPALRKARMPRADMPHSHTMCCAMSVARSMSFEAPLVMCFMKSSSATRPPISTAICVSR